jgi:hypothetical protein
LRHAANLLAEKPVNPELEGYHDQLLTIRQEAPGIVGTLNDAQLNQRPAPDKWSIVECFGHLNISASQFMPLFDSAIADARRRGLTGDGPFAYPFLQRALARSMEPPPRFRSKTRKVFRPPQHAPGAEVLREFEDWQRQFAERLRAADGLDLRRARMRSPVASWLHYCVGIGFQVFLAHERRHLWQARQVRLFLEHG